MRVHKRIIVQVAGTISALNTVGKWFVSLFFFYIIIIVFNFWGASPTVNMHNIISKMQWDHICYYE